MRWILLLFLLLSTGCSLPHLAQKGAESLFDQGLKEMAADKKPKSLAELQRRFPESTWARRASVLSRLYAARQNTDKQLQVLEQELSDCSTKSRQDQEELLQLRNDLQALKQLVIETEKRAK